MKSLPYQVCCSGMILAAFATRKKAYEYADWRRRETGDDYQVIDASQARSEAYRAANKRHPLPIGGTHD